MRTFIKLVILLFLIASLSYLSLRWRTNYSDLKDSAEKNQYFKTECTSACQAINSKVADCVQLCENDMHKQWRAYDTCSKTMEPLSEEQRRMHFCFIDGSFTAMPPDGIPSIVDKTSLIFLQPVAEAGNVWAQARLGWMYESGLGIAKNYDLAIQWYEKAADQGDMVAQQSLGQMYRYGKYDGGVKKDYVKALKWFRLSAEQGNRMSQQHMGDMYKQGLGVKQSDIEACFWYEVASAEYSEAISARRNCAEKLTPGQRLEIETRKKAWKEASRPHDR